MIDLKNLDLCLWFRPYSLLSGIGQFRPSYPLPGTPLSLIPFPGSPTVHTRLRRTFPTYGDSLQIYLGLQSPNLILGFGTTFTGTNWGPMNPMMSTLRSTFDPIAVGVPTTPSICGLGDLRRTKSVNFRNVSFRAPRLHY